MRDVINFETTPAQRARIRELAEQPAMDDYDRSVIMLLDDFARAIVLIAILADSASRAPPQDTEAAADK